MPLDPTDPGWERPRTVRGEELSDAELEQLLARLPDLEALDGDEVEFLRRAESLRPPLTAEILEGEWPPDLSSPTAQPAPDGPLQVVAFRPDGEVNPPFQLAIAFDRPVTSVGAVGEHEIPAVSLTPEIEGRWRWLGTQTLIFEPANTWPMATEFQVEVPAGIEPIDGGALQEAVAFQFTTPAPQIQTVYPGRGGPYGTDEPVLVVFNQPIDEATAQSIEVRRGDQTQAMRLLSGEAFDEAVEKWRLGTAAENGRVLALAPVQDYEANSQITVRASGPLISSEGPVVGTSQHTSTFLVRGAFELENVHCGNQRLCRPTSPIRLTFSNPVDTESGQPEISVDPPVDALSVQGTGRSLLLRGDFQPYTTYRVEVADDLEDTFGQTIVGNREGTIRFDGFPSMMAGPNLPMVVRPTTMPATLPIVATEWEELRVRVFDVSPDDWQRFQEVHRNRNQELWTQAVREEILRFTAEERRNRRELEIDLSAALNDQGMGHAMVIIDMPLPWPADSWRRRDEVRWVYWVQRTDLAADISSDFENINVKVTTISDGSAVTDADIMLRGRHITRSDRQGQATIAVPRREDSQATLVVGRGEDTLMIPVNGNATNMWSSTSWTYRGHEVNLQWYVVDDRQMYRPGETVRLRGWMRKLEASPTSRPQGVDRGTTVTFRVTEARRNEIATGVVEVDRFGGFDVEFEIPEGANLGHASIQFTARGAGTTRPNEMYRHPFQIQEFRRPEYEVTLTSSAGPHRVDGQTHWTALASYYAGGALSGAATTWRFSESQASYSPAGWQGWTFGSWSPWWFHGYHLGGRGFHRGAVGGSSGFEVLPAEFRQAVSGQTDSSGRMVVSTNFERPERGLPRSVRATVSVTDVNRQTWEANESVLVHPADVYVGLRAEKTFIQRGESWDVEVAAVGIDGDVAEGRPLTLEVKRSLSGQVETVDSCEEISGADPVTCSFSGLAPGFYQVVASVEDESGRMAETELAFWVAGQDRRGAQTAEEGSLLLIPEADEFAVGETARLFVQAPYYPLEAVVELRRDGLLQRREVTITEENPIVEVEIEERMIPNIHVAVSAIGSGPAYEADAFASGTIELRVDRAPRSLQVRINPEADQISPGQTIDVGVEVVNAAGNPVSNAQVLLFAVDESVLALSDYSLRDPLAIFYPPRQARMGDIRSRAWLLLQAERENAEESDIDAEDTFSVGLGASSEGTRGEVMARPRARSAAPAAGSIPLLSESGSPSGASGGSGPPTPEPIAVREVFDALAFFHGDLVTDANGRVSISETMPESLTRYRIMAVAIDGDTDFGSGETDITARLPLMVRPSEPRFLNVGDEFDFAVVVHNQTTSPMAVDLGLRATSALEWLETPGRRVEVPAADRVEVRWRARAKSAGDVRVQIVGASGVYGDAEQATFPVLTPATTEAFATYGSLDEVDAILEALNVPQDAYSQYGGLEFSASSTQLQALTDSFIYLTNYRFNCTEQLSSRILSVLALYDVLDAFSAPNLTSPEVLRASVDRWITEIVQNQRSDGGFGFWAGSRESWPYVTAHAAFALWQASEAGYEVPDRVLSSSQAYLRNMPNHVSNYHRRAAATIEAYALYVRHRSGQEPAARELDSLITRVGIDELSLEALGWLLPLAQGTQWEARFLQRIQNQVQETSATAEFQETYTADAHRILHTTRRTDGVVLDGLMQVDPDHHLVEKVVRGLLAHRSRGHWRNTQENVFILMALRRYFDEYESVEPDFVARAWLGEEQIAEHVFRGRTTEQYEVNVPMSFLHEGDRVQPMVVQRDGEGRMYYRFGVRYAPTSRHMPSLDNGFQVARNYEAIDNDDDVRREDDGTWTVKAGARVLVQLTMTVPARRYHVALVDWLPAGFEPINTALAVSSVESGLTGGTSSRRSYWGWWGWPWYEHQNMRDERVEAFASLVSQGVYTYSYVARATTPGEFIAMPAKAEEMYHPETFGRSSTELVRVVD